MAKLLLFPFVHLVMYSLWRIHCSGFLSVFNSDSRALERLRQFVIILLTLSMRTASDMNGTIHNNQHFSKGFPPLAECQLT